ncbi:hypothetical protein SBA6_390006 [Candidatus Sulfopaludibacter sp. SbA6]|nr:hypothetical protein SBA6_390006 [Candidatus Sulfopaludibacter sp. SbA6]
MRADRGCVRRVAAGAKSVAAPDFRYWFSLNFLAIAVSSPSVLELDHAEDENREA